MKAHRVVPRLLMAAGLTLPVVTTVEFLSHVGLRGLATARSLPAHSGRVRKGNPPSNSGTATNHSAPPPRSHTAKSGAFTGPAVQGWFGPVQAQLTVTGRKIMNVNISAPQDNPTSQYINSIAVPMLRSETLRAQSANINVISGATVTSDAYYQSLLSALKNAHL
jgi:uncharacterized protein with FMN-binding domain